MEQTLENLTAAGCVRVLEDEGVVEPLALGRITCFYYLQHRTAAVFAQALQQDMNFK